MIKNLTLIFLFILSGNVFTQKEYRALEIVMVGKGRVSIVGLVTFGAEQPSRLRYAHVKVYSGCLRIGHKVVSASIVHMVFFGAWLVQRAFRDIADAVTLEPS